MNARASERDGRVDTGKIRGTEGAEGWIALFITSEASRYEALPVIKWVHVIRNGVDHIEGVVPVDWSPTGVFVTFIDQPRVFLRYIYAPLETEQSLQNQIQNAYELGEYLAQMKEQEAYGANNFQTEYADEAEPTIPEAADETDEVEQTEPVEEEGGPSSGENN